MRANRKMREFSQDKAEVGIGTMIVFIATVLVAAIAAGVLLDTSGKLQERSSKTGQAATDQVSSNLAVESIIGKRNATTDTEILWLELFVNLAPGAKPVDVNQLKIAWNTATEAGWLNYTNENWGENNEFTAVSVRDPDSSYLPASSQYVMTEGDTLRIKIHTKDTDGLGADLAVRNSMTLLFQPEVGLPLEYGFTTPAAYGSNLNLELR